MQNIFERTQSLIGETAMNRLITAKVLVMGVGGVGSATVEALARAGVGAITVIDSDVVSETNINRQLIALHSTIGKPKVDVVTQRVLDINPDCKVLAIRLFIDRGALNDIIGNNYDYVVDAVDTVGAKLDIAAYCEENNIPLISCLGTGNKLDPTAFLIADIKDTSVCPLAKVMRKELKERGVKKLKVLYSKEVPQKVVVEQVNGRHVPASISFVPPVAGMIIAGEVIRDLIK